MIGRRDGIGAVMGKIGNRLRHGKSGGSRTECREGCGDCE